MYEALERCVASSRLPGARLLRTPVSPQMSGISTAAMPSLDTNASFADGSSCECSSAPAYVTLRRAAPRFSETQAFIMMRIPARALALFAVVTTMLTACGSSSTDTTSPPQTVRTLGSISVTAPALSVAAGELSTISTNAFDTSNAALAGVTFSYVSSNPGVAEVSADGSVLALSAGTSTVTVTGTLSGVTKTATAVVTVSGTLPTSASVVGGASGFTFAPPTVVIKTGGSVAWTWGATAHNVTFDAVAGVPASIGTGGNVSATRTFNSAGNFAYQCTIHAGMTGKVVVR